MENKYSVHVIEMARRIYGDEAMKQLSEINAFIQRMVGDFEKENSWMKYKETLDPTTFNDMILS